MIKIDGFYDKTGNFETYVGNILIVNGSLIVPIYNSQLREHILCKNDKITYHLDYCYYIFKNVIESKRDVYDNFTNLKFTDVNYFVTNNFKENNCDFLLELLDYKGDFQYWNWIIKADAFSIIVEENYELREKPYAYNEMSVEFFEKNHYEILKDIL